MGAEIPGGRGEGSVVIVVVVVVVVVRLASSLSSLVSQLDSRE